MIKIAIQGHPTRGKEVIQILESLGGKNNASFKGTKDLWYFIDLNGNIVNEYQFVLTRTGFKTYTLEEFEKEFPFKIGDKVTIAGLPDFPKVITQMAWECDEILYSFEGLNNTWFGAKSLKKFEMKEERNITLTLDKAKEWYNEGGELRKIALQAYSEEELCKVKLPKTWKEFCDNYIINDTEAYFDCCSTICSAIPTYRNSAHDKNLCPCKESAEAHLALIQLEQLRDCYRQGDIPDFNDDNTKKYCILKIKNDICVKTSYNTNSFLSFTKKEVAEEFLTNFKPLIKIAEDYI